MTFIEEEPAVDSAAEWVEPEVSDADDDAAQEDGDAQSTHALFDGDEGGLDLNERKALVVLLKNRFITPESNPKDWRTILASRSVIAQRLNDLFLELKLDLEQEVAYKRPVTSDAGTREFPTLLHDTAWSRDETALLVFLRVRARAEQARGELHARVSQAEIDQYLDDNRPDSATDKVKERDRGSRAISSLKTAGLLVKTDEDGVFRISPAIETMLPVRVLTDLLSWLNVRMATGAQTEEETTIEEQP